MSNSFIAKKAKTAKVSISRQMIVICSLQIPHMSITMDSGNPQIKYGIGVCIWEKRHPQRKSSIRERKKCRHPACRSQGESPHIHSYYVSFFAVNDLFRFTSNASMQETNPPVVKSERKVFYPSPCVYRALRPILPKESMKNG